MAETPFKELEDYDLDGYPSPLDDDVSMPIVPEEEDFGIDPFETTPGYLAAIRDGIPPETILYARDTEGMTYDPEARMFFEDDVEDPFESTPGYLAAIRDGIPRETILYARDTEGMTYDGEAQRFFGDDVEEPLPSQEDPLLDTASTGFFTERMEDVAALAHDIPYDTVVYARDKGFKYDANRELFITNASTLLTDEEAKRIERLRDQRPNMDALRKMIFFAGSGLTATEVDQTYWNRHREEWSNIDVTESGLREALENAKMNVERERTVRRNAVENEASIPDAMRFLDAGIGGTSITRGEGMLETTYGDTVREAIAREMSHEVLAETLTKMIKYGPSETGSGTFEDFRDAFSNVDGRLLDSMTVEDFDRGPVGAKLHKSYEDRDWAEILGVTEEEPSVGDYVAGTAKSVGKMATLGVARGFMELTGLVAVAAKNVLYDPAVGTLKDAANYGEMLGDDAFKVFGADMPTMKGMDQQTFSPSGEKIVVQTRDGDEVTSEEHRAQWKPSSAEDRFVGDMDEGLQGHSSYLLKEVGDIVSAVPAVAVGLAVGVAEVTTTGYQMVTFNEKGYKKFVNFALEHPLDLAALGSLPVLAARSVTASTIMTARRALAASTDAFETAYVAAGKSGGFVKMPPGPKGAFGAGTRPSGALGPTRAVTAGEEAAAAADAAHWAGVPAGESAGVLDGINRALGRGLSQASVEEAMGAMKSAPKDPKLFKLHAKRVADEVKLKMLEQRYATLTNVVKVVDPASSMLAGAARIVKGLSPALQQKFRSRAAILAEAVLDGPTYDKPIRLIDIIAETNQGLADDIIENGRVGNAAPEELLREIDDFIRTSPAISGVDSWIILENGEQLQLSSAPKEPSLSTIFGRELDDSEKTAMLNTPKAVETKIASNAEEASKNIDQAVNDRLSMSRKLGLMPEEGAHLFSIMNYALFLESLDGLPTTFKGMRKAEHASIKSSFVRRRSQSSRRATAKERLMYMMKRPEGFSKGDQILLTNIVDEITAVGHEWGSRRNSGLIDEIADSFSESSTRIQSLIDGMDSKRKVQVQNLVNKIRKSDADILSIDRTAIEVLDRLYRSELIDRTGFDLFGAGPSKLRMLADETPMSIEQRSLLTAAIEEYEIEVRRLGAAGAKTKSSRIAKKQRKQASTAVKAKTKGVQDELVSGEKSSDVQISQLTDEIKAELTTVRTEIIDALAELKKRQDTVTSIRASRAEKIQAESMIEQAIATGGDGSMGGQIMMMRAGLVPRAVPMKHIELAQAVKLLGETIDDNMRLLQENALKNNGMSFDDVNLLGDDAKRYLDWVHKNYGDTAAMKDATVVMSVRPLNMVEDVKIAELKSFAKRSTSDKIEILKQRQEALANPKRTRTLAQTLKQREALKSGDPDQARTASGADMDLGYEPGRALEEYHFLKSKGREIPKSLQDDVNAIAMVAASDIRQTVFRTTAEAIEEGLLDPNLARLRVATYFPDLYSQFEKVLRVDVGAGGLDLGHGYKPIIDQAVGDYKVNGSNFRYSRNKFLPLEERRANGLIQDPAAVFVIGMNRIQGDIAKSKMFRQMRESTIAEGPFKGYNLAMTPEEFAAKLDQPIVGTGVSANVERLKAEAKKLGWKRIPGRYTETVDPTSTTMEILSGVNPMSKSYNKGSSKRLSQNYGELSGMYVPEALYDDVVKVADAQNAGLALYSKFLRAWKFGKTALNPATQTRNHVGNWFVADMNGMTTSPTAWDVAINDDIVHQAWTHEGPLVEEAISSGLFGTSLNDIEIQGAYGRRVGLPSGLKGVMGRIKRGEMGGPEAAFEVTDGILNAGVKRSTMMDDLKGLPGHSYQFGDEVYKLWRYGQIRRFQKEFLTKNNLTKEMKRAFGGQEEALAVLNIRNASLAKRAAVQRVFDDGFLDYSRVSSAVNWARKGWSPFITFTAEMLPRFLERQRQHPLKALAYRQTFRSLNNYTERLDGTPTLAELQEAATAEELLPSYAKIGAFYAGRETVKTSDGEFLSHSFYDVSPYGIMGGLYKAKEGEWGFYDYIPDFLKPNEPLLDLAGRLIWNRGEFSDEDGSLYRPDDSGWRKAGAMLQLSSNKLLPSFMGGRSIDKIYSAMTGKPYSTRGKHMSVWEALEDAVLGIRTTKVIDPDIDSRVEYEQRVAKMPMTQDDFYLKKQKPEEWNKLVKERLEIIESNSRQRKANRDKNLEGELLGRYRRARMMKELEAMVGD